MATITITNAKVNRVIQDMGFEVAESYETRDGDIKETKFTVWTTPNNIPAEGATVNVSGNVSVRLEEYNGNKFARFHVNQPTVNLVSSPPAADPFQTTDQQVPF